MVQVAEGVSGAASSSLNASLISGLRSLSRDQTVTFTRYVRLVLPLDGFVFWVRAGLVSDSALFGKAKYDAAEFGDPGRTVGPGGTDTVTVKGSLHYNVANLQREDENFSLNRVVFTTMEEIQDLNAVTGNSVYIGEFDFPPEPPFLGENPADRRIRFAFSGQGYFYSAAGTWHYQGDAVYPSMETQVVDTLAGFDGRSLVVSNSLPFWLSFSNPSVAPWVPPREVFPVYPSYSVPGNLKPPYASVHVEPSGTGSIAAAPLVSSKDSSLTQLSRDLVRVTLYGLRNDAAQQFRAAVLQASVDFGAIGVMNVPTVRDEKRTQVELEILAMKKTVEFEVSYYQSDVNDFAVRSIRDAIPSFVF